MKQYTVAYTNGAYSYIKVEADSPEEARLIADETFEAPFICAQCGGWGRDGEPAIEVGDVWEQDESDDGVWES